MTFAQFLSVLRARKLAALLVFALVVATTLIVSLVLPKQYTGTASVVVDVKPDPVAAIAFQAMTSPTFMATQVDIMTSERVALRVIRDLKLVDNPQIRQQWQDETQGQGTIEQWLIAALQKQLDVKPSTQSNVIQVSYKAIDARYAAGLANAYAQAYIATTLDLRVDPAKQFTSFFGTQSREARDALERAQKRLSAFQQDKGIIASDERLDVENARLNELSTQLVQMQALASESRSRETQAQGGDADRTQEVLNNQLISSLKADLSRNEAKLQELTQRLGDAHPQVLEARANIEELRRRIDAEIKRVSGGVRVSSTINRQREAQVRLELAAQRAKVLHMKAVRDEGQVLQREIESAQRTYDNLMGRLNQTALEAQTTQSYANILTSAQPPTDPSSPKILLNTALAIVLGAMLAIGVAILLELVDRRVRTVDDIVPMLGLPVLGALPTPAAKRFVYSNRALPLVQQPIGLPAPTQGA